jgi:membrane-bound lytic murein transglycosylase B
MPFARPLPHTDRHAATRLPTLVGAACIAAALAIGPLSGHAQGLSSKTRPGQTVTGWAHQHPPALAFARELDERHGWSDGWAERWLKVAQRNPQVIRLMRPAPAGSARHWGVYRDRFVEPRRLQAGVRFWQAHEAALQRAEAEFGVPAWLIVGIIGVETLYGQHTGTFPVLDALATLAFEFPPEHPRAAQRTAFFKAELEALLHKSRSAGVTPDTWLGSFAGAIGLPQFMPSNWALYGVDYDGDGRVDLQHSAPDAIASVARYLQAFGWETGMPTHFALRLEADSPALEALRAPSVLPTFTSQALQALGAIPEPAAQAHDGLLAFIELENGDPARGGAAPTYVAGTRNFYAITRYNQSSFYAMAVIELGQAVQTLRRP